MIGVPEFWREIMNAKTLVETSRRHAFSFCAGRKLLGASCAIPQ